MSNKWTKTGDWVQRWNAAPSYRHASGRVVVSGGYGTTGDNLRGWRKGRFYRVVAINVDGVKEIGHASSLATAKAVAEKFLSTSN
jgi:hypothetical protein